MDKYRDKVALEDEIYIISSSILVEFFNSTNIYELQQSVIEYIDTHKKELEETILPTHYMYSYSNNDVDLINSTNIHLVKNINKVILMFLKTSNGIYIPNKKITNEFKLFNETLIFNKGDTDGCFNN